ncbi:MAG: ABC transporter substrate-binding protein [Lacisediminihabitans sp.]
MNVLNTAQKGPNMDRRNFLRAAILVPTLGGTGLTLLLSGCSTPTPGGDKKKPDSQKSTRPVVQQTYSTPFGFIPTFMDAYVAAEEGFWTEQGLDITVRGGQGASAGLQSVFAGSAQYGRSGGALLTADMIMKDIPVKVFFQAEQGGWQIVSTNSHPITKPEQLRGKTLGVVSAGGETSTLMKIMLAKAGIQLSEITTPVVGVGPGAYQLAKDNKIDAWIALTQDVFTFQEQGLPVQSFSLSEEAEVPGEAYVADIKLLESDRESVVGFAAGLLKAYEFLNKPANVDKAYAHYQVYNPGGARNVFEDYLKVLLKEWYVKGAKSIGEIDPKEWDHGQQILKKYGVVDKTVAVSRLVDADIVKEAKKRLA